MKIAIDKSIMLSDLPEAKEMRKGWTGVFDEESLRITAISSVSNLIPHWAELVRIEELKITRNRHKLTIWATVMLKSSDTIIVTSFDLIQAYQGSAIDTYAQVYKLAE